MDENGIHELTAAYALDALDEHEEREYEEHLRRCPRCRGNLSSMRETAGLLAYGAEPAAPPPGLRNRIVEQARSERQNVVPLRRRWVYRSAVAAAAIAASFAVGLGIWAASLSSDLDRERSARDREAQAIELVADPGVRQIPLRGATGRLAVSGTGAAALVITGLAPAGEKTYEAWVIQDGAPKPAGIFDADGGREIFLLTRPVPRGAQVAVTLEEREVQAPAGDIQFTAQA